MARTRESFSKVSWNNLYMLRLGKDRRSPLKHHPLGVIGHRDKKNIVLGMVSVGASPQLVLLPSHDAALPQFGRLNSANLVYHRTRHFRCPLSSRTIRSVPGKRKKRKACWTGMSHRLPGFRANLRGETTARKWAARSTTSLWLFVKLCLEPPSGFCPPLAVSIEG